ncbi:helix-turn-helix domain-containing protein [Sphingobacterium sp. LRF_L2]|uniref:helix-turn-helix domain-containing protein n=1 Tax=Sphingobacterium sp. LRF_L2 TaxID=3369421 RepID=UPI003F62BBC6
MYGEETYRKEYGRQVAKYLNAFGLTEEDLGKLINSSSDNVRDIVSGKVGLSLSKMIKIANVFSVHYYDFANPGYPLPEERHLSRITKKKIERRKSIGIIQRDQSGFLAQELDRLIREGALNTPKTAKDLHLQMDEQLSKRSATEITNLLNKPPRNLFIIKLSKKISKQNTYIHKDFFVAYEASDPDLFSVVDE